MIITLTNVVKMAAPIHHSEHDASSIDDHNCDPRPPVCTFRKRHCAHTRDVRSCRGCRTAITKSSLGGLTLAVMAFACVSPLKVAPPSVMASPNRVGLEGKEMSQWAFKSGELGMTGAGFKIRSLGGEEGGHSHEEDHINSAENFQSYQDEIKEDSQPWGRVIGATLLVNLASLTGLVIVVIPAMRQGYLKFKGVGRMAHGSNTNTKGRGKLLDICVPAFAVGALMATAVFLIFPEGDFSQNLRSPFSSISISTNLLTPPLFYFFS